MITKAITNDDGMVQFSNLHLGKYYVKETNAPDGYLVNTKEFDVELKYKDQYTKVIADTKTSLENVKKMGVHIFKSGIKENSGETLELEGAEFTLKLKEVKNMNQIKIGKFIAECRKKNNLTQMQLAEKLSITDRAISKWENGKGMPDSSIMLDLCNELKISVNELLCGELIEMNNYNEVAEKTLLEMAQKEEMQNKKLMMYENVIGFSSTISFLILIFVTSFLVENNIAKIVLFILAFILLIIGVSFALKIETETGYYECQKCHYKYVPKYSQVYFAMHSGTTRYMKCPKCNKKSWQRKTLSK